MYPTQPFIPLNKKFNYQILYIFIHLQTSKIPYPAFSGNQGHDNLGSRLLKLNFPTFSGNSLPWVIFWDCFEAAVHSNSSLGGVQNFSYLKAQLIGDA